MGNEFEDQVIKAKAAEASRIQQESQRQGNISRERQEASDLYRVRTAEAIQECQQRLDQDPRNQAIIDFLQGERLAKAVKYISENVWYQPFDVEALRVETIRVGGVFSSFVKEKVSENAYIRLPTTVVRKPLTTMIALPRESVSDQGVRVYQERYTVGKDSPLTKEVTRAKRFFVLPTKRFGDRDISDNPAYQYYQEQGKHFEFTEETLQQMVDMALVEGGRFYVQGGVRKYPRHYARESYQLTDPDYGTETSWHTVLKEAADKTIGLGVSAHWDPKSQKIVYVTQNVAAKDSFPEALQTTDENTFFNWLAQRVAKGETMESYAGRLPELSFYNSDEIK